MSPLDQARDRLAAIEAINPKSTRLNLEDLHTLALSAALMAVTLAEIAEEEAQRHIDTEAAAWAVLVDAGVCRTRADGSAVSLADAVAVLVDRRRPASRAPAVASPDRLT